MDDAGAVPVARARTRRARRIPAIWLIPMLAVGIGLWLAWDTYSKRGPEITVEFETAEGLQPGQSQLKYKDVVFGTVRRVALTPDRAHVLVTVQTTHEATPLLTKSTIFWIVKPRLFAGSLSGLSTLLSGAYIGMLPGSSSDPAWHAFIGQEDPPVLQSQLPGRHFVLQAARLGSVSLGSPVFFRDQEVGQVLGWDVAKMAASVTIHVFVRAPFDAYVHDESRFWDASGVSVSLAGSRLSDVRRP